MRRLPLRHRFLRRTEPPHSHRSGGTDGYPEEGCFSDETVDSEEAIQAREKRNLVAALISESLGEIREAARYLFRNDSARLSPFLSRYVANKMARSRKKAAARAVVNG
ncbi:MAG: hypothetical protein AB2A00_07490 [Myxococcota bacterium]